MADSKVLNATQFAFELVSPEKVEMSSVETSVILPGEEGDFTVLAGHTQLLSALRPGVVTVEREQGESFHYYISGGFADVGNAHCIVLTPHITPANKLPVDALNTEIAALEAKLDETLLQDERDPLMAQLDVVREKRDIALKYAS